MKLKNANEIRSKFLDEIMALYETEDIGTIASNSFNMPVVAEDGEEGWVEIVVKVTKDNGDDGYMKREQYKDKVAENKAKADAKAKAKADKIAKDNAKREKEKAEKSA